VDIELNGLGDQTASQLSAATHRDGSWLSARGRAGVAAMERSQEELRENEIFEFFLGITATDANANGER
jgi:hypothetical protein